MKLTIIVRIHDAHCSITNETLDTVGMEVEALEGDPVHDAGQFVAFVAVEGAFDARLGRQNVLEQFGRVYVAVKRDFCGFLRLF